MAFIDRQGVELRVLDERGSSTNLSISPDGRKAAVPVRTKATGLTDIWIYDLARGVSDRFTSDPGMEAYPVWSPDGRTLVYSMGTGSTPRLVKRPLSAATAQPIEAPGVFQLPGSIASDGTLYYISNEQRTRRDIFRTALDGTKIAKVLDSEFNEFSPAVSPDGRWLAYISDATKRMEVYVLDLTTSERIRISNRGGYAARWSASGELFYVTPDNVVVSVKPRVAGRWDDVVTVDLFKTSVDIATFDVMPDGQSLLVSQWTRGAADGHIHVATGW
jgi:Tol biopolymer transport system component